MNNFCKGVVFTSIYIFLLGFAASSRMITMGAYLGLMAGLCAAAGGWLLGAAISRVRKRVKARRIQTATGAALDALVGGRADGETDAKVRRANFARFAVDAEQPGFETTWLGNYMEHFSPCDCKLCVAAYERNREFVEHG